MTAATSVDTTINELIAQGHNAATLNEARALFTQAGIVKMADYDARAVAARESFVLNRVAKFDGNVARWISRHLDAADVTDADRAAIAASSVESMDTQIAKLIAARDALIANAPAPVVESETAESGKSGK